MLLDRTYKQQRKITNEENGLADNRRNAPINSLSE